MSEQETLDDDWLEMELAKSRAREASWQEYVDSLGPRGRARAEVLRTLHAWLGRKPLPEDEGVSRFSMWTPDSFNDPKEDEYTGLSWLVSDYMAELSGWPEDEVDDAIGLARAKRQGLLQRSIADDPEKVARLVSDAEKDEIAYEACLEVVLVCARDVPDEGGGGVPDELFGFLYDVLHGRKKRPKSPGPRPWSDVWRNVRIIFAIHQAMRVDPTLRPTRNDASRSSTDVISACDIVAECLHLVGVNMSYKRVVDVWSKRRR